jgi:hypothetical protein
MFYTSIHLSLIVYDENEEVIGMFVNAYDITDRKEFEEQLKIS